MGTKQLDRCFGGTCVCRVVGASYLKLLQIGVHNYEGAEGVSHFTFEGSSCLDVLIARSN
jgi:hypothetical protein